MTIEAVADTVGAVADTVEAVADTVPYRTILLVGAGVTLAATVGQWAIAAGIGPSIQLVGFAVVAAGIVAGRPARWGSAAALLVVGFLFGGWSSGVAWAIAGFTAAAVSTRLWVRDDGDRDEGWVPWALRYGVVVTAGVLIFAATSSWLLDVLGRAAFSVTVDRTVAANLPLAVVGAPAVRLATERLEVGGRGAPDRPVTARKRAAVVLTVLVWTVGGYVGSFLFRVVNQVPMEAIGRRFSLTVENFIAIWGVQGTYAQLLLGVVSLAVVAVLLRR